MKKFAVAHADSFNNELIIELVEVSPEEAWQEAVQKHSKYPYTGKSCDTCKGTGGFELFGICTDCEGTGLDREQPGVPVEELCSRYPEHGPEESFKQSCFDCDCLMDWKEIL